MHRENVGFVRLYLDDVDDILERARELSKGVTLRAGEATADDAADLVHATPAELKDLTVTTTDPGVVVQLGPKNAAVVALDRSNAASDLAEGLARLIRMRRYRRAMLRRLAFWYPMGYGLFLLVLGVVSFISVGRPGSTGAQLATAITMTAIALVIIVLALVYSARQSGVRLVVARRAELRTVASDRRFRFWSSVLSAIVGAAIGALVTWLVK